MAVAFVQSSTNIPGSGGNPAITLTFTAGNLICGTVCYDGAGSLTNVNDGSTNATVVDTVTDTTNNQKVSSFYFKNCAGGSKTITATIATSSANTGMMLHEVSGCDTTVPLDKHAINFQSSPGTSTDAVTSGSQTTTGNGEYIFGNMWSTSGNDETITKGSAAAWTQREHPAITNFLKGMSEDQVQTTAGAIAAVFTTSLNNAQITALMAFAPPTSSSASPFSATGTNTATFVGASLDSATVNASATSTATFVGKSLASSALNAPETLTATLVGASLASAPVTMAEVLSMTPVGASLASAPVTATETLTMTPVGASLASSPISSIGAAAATFVSSSAAGSASDWTASGASTMTGKGASSASAAFSFGGAATMTMVGASTVSAGFKSSGICTVVGVTSRSRSSLTRTSGRRKKQIENEERELMELIPHIMDLIGSNYDAPH